MGIGGWEVLVILFVVLLVFGPKRIPEVARGLGKGMRELRRISTEFQREINLSGIDDPIETRPKDTAAPLREISPRQDAADLPEISPRKDEVIPRDSAQAPEGRE